MNDLNSSEQVISLLHDPNGFKYMVTVSPNEKLSILNEIFDYSPKLEFWSNGKFLDTSLPFSAINDTIIGHPNVRSFIQTDERMRKKANYQPDQKTISVWLMIWGIKEPKHLTVNLDDPLSTILSLCPQMPNAGLMKRGHIMNLNNTFRKNSVPDGCWLYYIPNIEKFYHAHDAYGLNTIDKVRWPSTFMNAPPLPFVLPEVGDGMRHRSTHEHILGNIL